MDCPVSRRRIAPASCILGLPCAFGIDVPEVERAGVDLDILLFVLLDADCFLGPYDILRGIDRTVRVLPAKYHPWNTPCRWARWER
jgi:hypothetical protein